MRGVYKKETIKDWVILYDFRVSRDIDRILDNLMKSSKRFGIRIDNPTVIKEIPRRIGAADLPKLYEHKVKEPRIILFFCS